MCDEEVKNGLLDFVIQKLPQFRYFCCFCSNASLKTGTLVIGWLGLGWSVAISAILTVMAIAKTDDNTDEVCEELICTESYYKLFIYLNSRERFDLWFMLSLSSFFFTLCTATVMSITLLFGVYRSKLTLIRIWLAVNIVAWILAVDLYVINVIALLVLWSKKLLPALIWIFSTNIGLGIYFYSISVVKSYYLREEENNKTQTRTGITACVKRCTEYMFQKIPIIKHPCGTKLRNDVLVVGWASLILLFSTHSWTIFKMIEWSIRGRIDISGFPYYIDEPDFKLTWVISSDKVISFILLAMTVILLIGVYKENINVIKTLILVFLTLWITSLVVYITFHILKPIFQCSRFREHNMAALFGTFLAFGFDFFCIVVIRSYYEEQIMQKMSRKSSRVQQER